jgi:hypothetical protein
MTDKPKHIRTKEELHTQATSLLRMTYEALHSVNLNGFAPFPCLSQEYIATYKRCVETCEKYSDIELAEYIKNNLQP